MWTSLPEVDREGLLSFMQMRIGDGYCFPLSPMWMLCDPNFYEVEPAPKVNF